VVGKTAGLQLSRRLFPQGKGTAGSNDTVRAAQETQQQDRRVVFGGTKHPARSVTDWGFPDPAL